MKVSWITNYPAFKSNRLFSDANCLGGAHAANGHWLEPYFRLHQTALEQGIEIGTSDVLPPEEADVALFMDLPPSVDVVKAFKERAPQLRTVLMVLESPLYRGFAFRSENHSHFDAVLTYDSSLVDNKKYFKYLLPVSTRGGHALSPPRGFKSRHIASLIGTNQHYGWRGRIQKFNKVKNNGWHYPPLDWVKDNFFVEELYSARRKIAKTFEELSPGSLDIYGMAWDTFPGWRGVLTESKVSALGKYRFNIAFENCVNNCGYISEKLFDALEAGTVPVYKGEVSIEKFVPAEAFIDARLFSSSHALVKYLLSLGEQEWIRLYEAGQSFLCSSEFRPFLPDAFAAAVLKVIKAGD